LNGIQEVSGSTPLSSTIEGPAGHPAGPSAFLARLDATAGPVSASQREDAMNLSLIETAGLNRLSNAVLLALRLYLGGFLIWGVWDNIVSPERMAEFVQFLTVIGSPAPELAAPVSVWAQFLVGVLLIPGLLTRWAGLLLAVNFLVAVALIGATQGVFADVTRELFGPMMCVLAGLVLATHGPGNLSLDARLTGRGSSPT
jgi:putative oxidoreductase